MNEMTDREKDLITEALLIQIKALSAMSGNVLTNDARRAITADINALNAILAKL